ncbi:MAG: hypothetical protein HQM16_14510, partial [Deltaproteobacteria bacterium]|nr:hypothetical protein [Deltaproteobacteria bacterium]
RFTDSKTKVFILIVCIISMVSLVILQGCSGLGEGDDQNNGGTTDGSGETAVNAQVLSLSGDAFYAAMGSTFQYLGQELDALSLVKVVPMNTETLNDTYELDCQDGDITAAVAGTYNFTDTNNFSADLTMTLTLNNCAAEVESEQSSEGTNCTYEGTLSGTIVCDVTAQAVAGTPTALIDCSSAETCTGLTVTFEGQDYTMGLTHLSGNFTELSEGVNPSGTACINGTSISDFSSLSTENFGISELTCTSSSGGGGDGDDDGDDDDDDDGQPCAMLCSELGGGDTASCCENFSAGACTWTGTTCSGTVTACSSVLDMGLCNTLSDYCVWSGGACANQ